MPAPPFPAPDLARLVGRITEIERRKNALAAEESDAVHAFAVAQVEASITAGPIDPDELERSIAAQVGLACGVSAVEGRRRLRVARDLHSGHTRVRELFAAGELSERKVAIITAATTHLDPAARAAVDQELAERRVETLGVGRTHDMARMIAARVAPEQFVARCQAARSSRRVSIRPAADGMADLIAHLPVEQAVSCYGALAKAVTDTYVRPEPVTRGRGEIMADTLVERLTGQARAADVNVEVQIVVPVEALLEPTGPLPATLPGHGPVPAAAILAGSAGRTTWRRLVTRDGIVIGGDSRRRTFSGFLEKLIRARDGDRCREPYCDAPIRHIDHIRRWADGGRTTFDNGRGLCAFHNLVRETRGWAAEVDNGVVTTITPTGQRHRSEPTVMPFTGSTSLRVVAAGADGFRPGTRPARNRSCRPRASSGMPAQ